MQNEAPVQEGDEVSVIIEAVGAKGDGIAKVKGFVLFVAGNKAGETVTVRITKVLKNVGFAQVVKRDAKKEKQEQYQKQAEPEPEPEPEEHYEDSETFGDE
ncbi:MAG TPA: TRAM domain-containing protein [Candidatus Nanoarchaeia archaeon]|nr:TRAM domain-containing protein [Candidatus Nanoarchaeia archaeon]